MRRRSTGASRRTGDLVAGGVLLAVVVAITLYAFGGLSPFHQTYPLYALVHDANQLVPGSPVRIDGLNEGSVTGVGHGPDGLTRVAMELATSARPLHVDATVQIRPRTFLEGGFYVDLSPGTPSAPGLRDGATIPAAQTSGPVQLYQVLSTFTTSYRSGLQHILSQTAIGLGGAGALRTLAPQLEPTLRDAAWIAQSARGSQPHDLSLLIRSSAEVTATLAANDQQLEELVRGLADTTTALTAREGALGESVAELDGLLREAPPALSSLDATLPALERFSAVAAPAVRQAPPLISGLSQAVGQFGSLVAPTERQRLVVALRAALVALPTLLVRLASTFPPVRTTAECLTNRVLPTLDTQVPDGSLSTGQPAWEDLLHALVGLAGNAQDFDGNGFWQRYEAGSGTQTLALPGGLEGTGANSITGARPVWMGPGTLPPLRPNAPCSAQPLVQLASATAPGGSG